VGLGFLTWEVVIMRVTGHILATLFKAIGRIFLAAIFCGIIGAGVVFLVSFVKSGHWPPDTLTIIAAVAIGVLSLYAGGVTVLMREAVRALQEAVRDVEHDAGSAIKGAATVAQEIEKHL
jgi:cytochrome c oxidase assembly factor CtaG